MSLLDLLGEKISNYKPKGRVAIIDEYPIIYHILSPDVFSDHRFPPIANHFAGKCGYNSFYVSEAIPEKFRLPILAHEFYEYREPYDTSQRRHRHHEAIKHEVRFARELGILPEYLEYRLELYRRLIKYCESKGENATNEKEDFRIFKAIRRRMC